MPGIVSYQCICHPQASSKDGRQANLGFDYSTREWPDRGLLFAKGEDTGLVIPAMTHPLEGRFFQSPRSLYSQNQTDMVYALTGTQRHASIETYC